MERIGRERNLNISTDPAGEDKLVAAMAAIQMIEDGMYIGLGTGSTVRLFAEELATRIKNGLDVLCVPTSQSTRLTCCELGIPMLDPLSCDALDIAFDGADQVDRKKNVIKGGGAAHTLEKVIATYAEKFVLMVDGQKLVNTLNAPVPIEVLPDAFRLVKRELERMGAHPILRSGPSKDGPVVTDNGFWIIDAEFGKIKNPDELAERLNQIPGVLEHGIFTNVDTVIVGREGDRLIL